MSSSTSSSELTPRARAIRIALLVIVALALFEWGTRLTIVPGSSDLDRYRGFPERARSLVAAPAPRIALIGNSVTDRVMLDLLQSEWKATTGDPLAADKFVAYYSNLTTWYWMIDRYFWEESLKPDLIVLTYYDEVGLADAPLTEVGALAQFFTDSNDVAALFTHDVRSLEQRAGYLLSSVSTAFATRDRIQNRVLNLIPGYRPFATATNSHNFEYQQRLQMRQDQPEPTFDTLRRLLARARQEGVRLCFVAFRPRPAASGRATYALHLEVLAAIAEAGMLHIDLRDMNELTVDLYQDNIHLNARGQPLYTRRLAQELDRIWHSR